MLIIDDYTLHCLKRNVDDVVNLVKTLITCSFSLSLFQIKFKICYCPFTAVFVVVVCGLFCNGYICQVNEHIVSFVLIVAVLFNTKTGKAQIV
jgi:hypothetical protein